MRAVRWAKTSVIVIDGRNKQESKTDGDRFKSLSVSVFLPLSSVLVSISIFVYVSLPFWFAFLQMVKNKINLLLIANILHIANLQSELQL